VEISDSELRTIVQRSHELRRLFAEETLILDVLTAAELTGIPRTTLYKLCRKTGIAVRFGVEFFVGANRLKTLMIARGNDSSAIDRAIALACAHGDRFERTTRER
jgi:hypothetical protein